MGIDNLYGLGSVRPGVCTSSTRPGSPFEGQVIYETDTDKVLAYNGSSWEEYRKATAGQVLQVLEAQVTTDQTFTSTSFLDVTNATVTITPSATSSKVLLFGGFEAGTAAGTGIIMQFVRTSTALFEPRFTSLTAAVTGQTHLIYLDSPATTSATTYKMQARTSGATSCTINNSTFFAMEISG